MKNLLPNIIKFLLFFGLGFAILYVVYQSFQKSYQAQCDLDFITECVKAGEAESICASRTPVGDCSLLDKIIQDFKSSNFLWLFVVMICFLISNVSRALRWNMLIRPLGHSVRLFNTFFATMAGYFANLALPRFGEVVKPGLVTKYEGIPIEKVMGTIVVDRLLDVVCLLSMIGLAFILEFDILYKYITENASGGEGMSLTKKIIFIGIPLAGIMTLILLWVFRKRVMEMAIYQKIKKIVIGFMEGMKTIAKLENKGLFIFHTLVIWLMYFLMTYLCFFAFAPTAHLGPVIGLVVFVFGGLGIVIPSPGGMGSYHFLVSAALIIYGVSAQDAFSFSNICFFTVNFCSILFGILAFILLPIYNKKNKVDLPQV